MPILKAIISWIHSHRVFVSFFSILIIAFAFFSAMKQAPMFMDGDPFYHAKVTQLILEEKGILKDFPWLPYSVFKDNYYDHHFLFHVFLLPFNALIGDPLIAIRVATSFLSALFLAIFYLFFKKLLPRLSVLPFFLVLVSSSLMFRLLLDKAPAISLIVLFGALYALLRRKHLALFIISFVYVWLYDAWPLLFIASILFCVADAFAVLFAQEQELSIRAFPFKKLFLLCVRKKNLILFTSCAGGLLAGIVINPYFPHNIFFYKTHLLSIAVVTGGVFYGIGKEWLPINPFVFGGDNTVFSVFWLCAFCWALFQLAVRFRCVSIPSNVKTPSTLSRESLFFLFFSLFLFLATVKSRRMSEYFIPIGSAYIVYALQDFFSRTQWREWFLSLRVCFKNASLKLQHIFCFIIALTLLAITLRSFLLSYVNLWTDINSRYFPFYSMGRVGAFISQNIPKGSLIINDNWSHFPQLMYYVDNYTFAWGLDPTFTHDAEPEFFKTLISLAQEKNTNTLASILIDNLHSRYLLITKDFAMQEKKLELLARHDKGLQKIYEDDEALMYKVKGK